MEKHYRKYPPRIDEDFALYEIESDPRASIAKVVIYGGTATLGAAALLSLYADSYAPLAATAAVVVTPMVWVVRHYFRGRREEDVMSKPTRRVQFEMPERSFERLRQMQEVTEAVSYAEVVRNALRVYEALWKQTANRGTIIVRQADGTEVPLNLMM